MTEEEHISVVVQKRITLTVMTGMNSEIPGTCGDNFELQKQFV